MTTRRERSLAPYSLPYRVPTKKSQGVRPVLCLACDKIIDRAYYHTLDFGAKDCRAICKAHSEATGHTEFRLIDGGQKNVDFSI